MRAKSISEHVRCVIYGRKMKSLERECKIWLCLGYLEVFFFCEEFISKGGNFKNIFFVFLKTLKKKLEIQIKKLIKKSKNCQGAEILEKYRKDSI